MVDGQTLAKILYPTKLRICIIWIPSYANDIGKFSEQM